MSRQLYSKTNGTAPGPLHGNNSIEYFRTTFLEERGIARPTLYEVSLSNGIGGINFQPETVTLPSRKLETIDDHFHGPIRKVPVGRGFDTSVVMVFPVSDDQNERAFFEQWMDQIVDPDTDIATPYLAGEPHGSMTIQTISSANPADVTSVYLFKEVYPVDIFPINLGFGMVNDYTRLQVQMEYREYVYWSPGYETTSDDNVSFLEDHGMLYEHIIGGPSATEDSNIYSRAGSFAGDVARTLTGLRHGAAGAAAGLGAAAEALWNNFWRGR